MDFLWNNNIFSFYSILIILIAFKDFRYNLFAKKIIIFSNFLSFPSDMRDFSPILKKIKSFNTLKS